MTVSGAITSAADPPGRQAQPSRRAGVPMTKAVIRGIGSCLPAPVVTNMSWLGGFAVEAGMRAMKPAGFSRTLSWS
jgi:hypothetical protein